VREKVCSILALISLAFLVIGSILVEMDYSIGGYIIATSIILGIYPALYLASR